MQCFQPLWFPYSSCFPVCSSPYLILIFSSSPFRLRLHHLCWLCADTTVCVRVCVCFGPFHFVNLHHLCSVAHFRFSPSHLLLHLFLLLRDLSTAAHLSLTDGAAPHSVFKQLLLWPSLLSSVQKLCRCCYLKCVSENMHACSETNAKQCNDTNVMC